MKCSKCGQIKTTKGKSFCSTCKSKYDQVYYTEEKRKDQRLRVKKRRQDLYKWLRSLKENKPCTDCNQVFHFAAMQWDHLPGTDKQGDVRKILNRTGSKDQVLEEISKCELVCSNCHAIRTYLRLSSSVDRASAF